MNVDSALDQFFIWLLEVNVGNGLSILFWSDPWLQGLSIEDIAPHLAAAVATKIKKRRSLAQALDHKAWLKDITIPVLMDYIRIRQMADNVVLQPETEDVFGWRWTGSRTFSVASAYQALFFGQTSVLGTKELWKTKAPKIGRVWPLNTVTTMAYNQLTNAASADKKRNRLTTCSFSVCLAEVWFKAFRQQLAAPDSLHGGPSHRLVDVIQEGGA